MYFIIKWISRQGVQHIYAGHDFTFTPKESSGTKQAFVQFWQPNDCECTFTEGVVYVMNDHGKTVADYNLDFYNR